jgi:penicillin-binding protein 1B
VPGLDGDWEPSNYDLEFRGEVTLRQALEESLNVPIARLGQEVGLRRIVATARRLGFTSRLRAVPSLALGAFEVTLLELTSAYAVLASGGTRTVPRSVRSVIDAEGNVLVAPPVEAESVFEPAETYLVTSALEGAVERGTGRGLRAHGYRGAVAGKTGTTNDYRDAWFIGYTPELAVGVWVGYDDGASLELTGAGAALPIFAEFLIGALGPEGGAVFPYPDGLEKMRVVARAGFPAGLRCDGASEVFLAGTGPESSCRRGGIGAFLDFFRFGRGSDRPTVSAGPPR